MRCGPARRGGDAGTPRGEATLERDAGWRSGDAMRGLDVGRRRR